MNKGVKARTEQQVEGPARFDSLERRPLESFIYDDQVHGRGKKK